jgi:hypothetical protein
MSRVMRWILAIGMTAVPAAAEQEVGLSERGVRLRQQTANVTYDIELVRGTQRAIVPSSYKFQNGDRFALRVKVATPSYLYILSRTFVGPPDELRSSRQIRLVPNPAPGTVTPSSPPSRAPAYSLLYPPSGDRLLQAGEVNLLPEASMALEMDEHPGVEHLVLVVSPTPLKIASMFNPTTGELRVPGGAAAGQQDRATELQTSLNHELAEMARNTEVEESSVPTRSIKFIKIETGPPPAAEPNPPSVAQAGIGAGTPIVAPEPASASGHASDSAPAPGDPSGAVRNAKSAPKAGTDPSSVGVPKRPEQPFLVDIILAHYGS